MNVGKNASAITVVVGDDNCPIYRVLDGQGNIIARILWDGKAPYDVESVWGVGASLQYEGPQPESAS